MGVYAVLWTQSLDALATMIVLPTIPFYAMGLGAGALTISALGSAYNLTQMICSPGLGALSDRVGRKNVMLAGLAGQALCNALMSYSSTLPSLLMIRVLAGVALSTGPAETAYIMDTVTSEAELSHVFALQRVMTSAGALIGPLVVSSLDDAPFPALCRGLVCVNLANLVVGAALWEDAPRRFGAPESRSSSTGVATSDVARAAQRGVAPDGNQPGLVASLRSVLANPTTCSLLLVSWVYSLSFGIGDGPEIVFFKDHFGFGKHEVCYFFVVTNLSSLLLSSVVPRVVDTYGARATCRAGCLGAAASVLLLTACPGVPWIPYACGAMEVGLFGSMIGLSYMHLARATCPEALMGTMMGLQSSLNGCAGTIGPAIGGALYGVGHFLPYVLSSALAASAAGLYAAMPAATHQERQPILPKTVAPPPTSGSAGVRAPSPPPAPWTYGRPLYPDKSFTTQVHANLVRLETDPELWELYQVYRGSIRRGRGPGDLMPVASVPGDMVVAHAQSMQHDYAELGRIGTAGDLVGMG